MPVLFTGLCRTVLWNKSNLVVRGDITIADTKN